MEKKPLYFKELNKLWEKVEPDLPYEKGRFTPSNTLLVDDSPCKALRNPVCYLTPFRPIFFFSFFWLSLLTAAENTKSLIWFAIYLSILLSLYYH